MRREGSGRFTRQDAIEVLHGAAAIAMGLMVLKETGDYPAAKNREWWMTPDTAPLPGAAKDGPLLEARAIADILDQPGTMNAEALYTTYAHWQRGGPPWAAAPEPARRTFAIVVALWPALRDAVAEEAAAAAVDPEPVAERASLKKAGRAKRSGAKTGGKEADKKPVPIQRVAFRPPGTTIERPRKGGRFVKKSA